MPVLRATNYMAGELMRKDAKLGIDAFINKNNPPDWKGR